ncbi:hypothetical protein [Streptococcus jiangjianxini]|uniref:hypothetical protein n=1 Tax=Streptococcus jiangjianxini TaxID=3161189 RepID=UPI0032EE186F
MDKDCATIFRVLPVDNVNREIKIALAIVIAAGGPFKVVDKDCDTIRRIFWWTMLIKKG